MVANQIRAYRYVIIIGAMKSGTTSLFNWLSNFDEIGASKQKDTRFFIDESQGGNYFKGYQWYCSQFRNTQVSKWRMEASTQYSKYPDYKGVPKRIWMKLNNPKIIYTVRNPIERTLSHFFHNLVVDGFSENINTVMSCYESKYFYYSDYALQIKQYLKYFDIKNIFIADFLDNHKINESLHDLLRFLQIKVNKSIQLNSLFPEENTLSSIVLRRKKQNNPIYSIDNRYKFSKLVRALNKGNFNNPVELSLAYGLRKNILSNLINDIQQKLVHFEMATSLNCKKWIEKYENYL